MGSGMDQLITLQAYSVASDGGGGSARTWADFATDAAVWASVVAKAGRESLQEGRVNASNIVLFTIYNRTDVSEVDRIIWNGEAYNIRNVRREGGRQLRLVIEAERGVAS